MHGLLGAGTTSQIQLVVSTSNVQQSAPPLPLLGEADLPPGSSWRRKTCQTRVGLHLASSECWPNLPHLAFVRASISSLLPTMRPTRSTVAKHDARWICAHLPSYRDALEPPEEQVALAPASARLAAQQSPRNRKV